MTKRDRFIAVVREEAARRGLTVSVLKGRGKGGHAVVRVSNGRWTTLPSRDIDPKTARKIMKALDLA
ncbi:MAG TPA: hypothetical protein VEA41_20840 [Salinarimonas sp.]|jgi:hypothetical protein|nr:hypothetical protein [Salinarimonas sp.]